LAAAALRATVFGSRASVEEDPRRFMLLACGDVDADFPFSLSFVLGSRAHTGFKLTMGMSPF